MLEALVLDRVAMGQTLFLRQLLALEVEEVQVLQAEKQADMEALAAAVVNTSVEAQVVLEQRIKVTLGQMVLVKVAAVVAVLEALEVLQGGQM